MLLKRLKSNHSITLVLIPVVALIFWIKSLLEPSIYRFSEYENSNILFAPIAKLAGNNPLVHVIMSLVLVIGLAFLMQLINHRYSFIRIRSKLPAIIFIIIISGFLSLHTLHPVYFGALFLSFAVYRLFSAFEQKKPYSTIFDTGFLLSIGSLFYSNLIIIFPALLIIIVLLSNGFKWREFIIIIIGLLLPFVFAISYATLNNSLTEAFEQFNKGFSIPINNLKNNFRLQFYLGVLAFYTILGSLSMLKQYDNKKISSRKYFSAFFWIAFFSILSFIFIPSSSQEILIITAIPLTFLIGNFFAFIKSRLVGEFLFLLLLAIVILLQFTEQLF